MSGSTISRDFESFDTLEPFGDFSRVIDDRVYHPIPDGWWIGISDVVKSTAAISAGRYKAVNLAGAATICAVSNALGQTSFPFAFGGDGAHFAVPPEKYDLVSRALAETAVWSRSALDLDLRTALVPVSDIRRAEADIRIARYASSRSVSHTMFSGGGVQWTERAVKHGRYAIDTLGYRGEPDLSGLSCQWGAVDSQNGTILSIMVNPAGKAGDAEFSGVVGQLLATLAKEPRLNPIPASGPKVRWPGESMALKLAIGKARENLPLVNRVTAYCTTASLWLLFKAGIRIGSFVPGNYRREIASNTDFQKYDDGLRMTIDCSEPRADLIENILRQAQEKNIVDYGLHRQETALLTCIATNPTDGEHIHFLDGAGGGYAQAAQDLKRRKNL